MTTPLNINFTYSFNTLAPAVLGTAVKNAKLIGILDYTTALLYDTIDLKYRQIYPLLPPGTPNAPTSSIYYRFLTESGEKIILADQWVNLPTVEIVEHINFNIIFTSAATGDMAKVRDALNALGYTNFSIVQTA